MSMTIFFSHSFLFLFVCLFFLLGREELLTEHVIHWDRRKIEGLPCSLAKCSTKVKSNEHLSKW